MKKIILLSCIGFFYLMFFADLSSAHAQDATQGRALPQCMNQYPQGGVRLTQIPQGWEGDVEAPFFLTAIGILEGPPTDRGEIKPFEQETNEGVDLIFKNLDDDPKAEKWLICRYNMIALYKRLPDGIKACTIRLFKNGGLRHITCQ